MPGFRATLLALTLAALAAAPAHAQADRAAAFDRFFEQLDSERLNPATPEAAQAEVAKLHALVPPGDRRRELLYQSVACLLPPDDVHAGLAYSQQGVAAARAIGDAELESRFQLCEAGMQEMLGHQQDALQLYSRGVELARRAERPALVADAMVLRGNSYSYLGRHAEALTDFMAAQRLYDASRQKERSEGNLQNIAVAYRRMGESSKAREYLERSDAAVIGRLVGVTPRGSQAATYKYRVRLVVKASPSIHPGQLLSVQSVQDSATCGLPSIRRRSYGLFLDRFRGRWTSNLCNVISPDEMRGAGRSETSVADPPGCD